MTQDPRVIAAPFRDWTVSEWERNLARLAGYPVIGAGHLYNKRNVTRMARAALGDILANVKDEMTWDGKCHASYRKTAQWERLIVQADRALAAYASLPEVA